MNITRLQKQHIDETPLDELVEEGLITQQEADVLSEYIVDRFANELRIAMEAKGYATELDFCQEPLSETLRRLRRGEKLEAAIPGCE